MKSAAYIKHIDISRRKISRLTRECRKKKVSEVIPKLSVLPQHAARAVIKAIKSAEANFLVKNPNCNADELLIESILAEGGSVMKRMLPRARGSADVIKRRSSHIRVVLTDGKKTGNGE